MFTSEKGIAGPRYWEEKCKFNWNGVCEGENYVQRAPQLEVLKFRGAYPAPTHTHIVSPPNSLSGSPCR